MDRVDKNDVRDIQPCKGVVFNDVRRRRERAIREHRDTLGANRAKVQPDRAGTRATIERDQEWTIFRVINAIKRVIRVEQQGINSAIFVFDRQIAGLCRVVQRLVAYFYRAL